MHTFFPYNTDARSFNLFLTLWNQSQKHSTPNVHLDIAKWLEARWNKKGKEEQLHLLLMAFRSCGKSTLVGLYAAWLLYKHPNLRIMVLAADSILASKMARNIKRIIERHPLTTNLKPDKADQWASDRFTVRRDIELRDPSVISYGVTANITGARADVIICDDVEVPNTCDSPDKRAELRERLLELDYILVPGGMQLYVGTPHSYYSIYAEEPREEIGEERAFLQDFNRLKIPILNKNGKSAWPERYRIEDIERMKVHTGVNKFTAQILRQPVKITEGRLNPKQLKIYEGEISYLKEIRRLEINNIPMVSASAFWDPSFGSIKGDGSVVAVIYMDAENNYYLHRLIYIKTDPQSTIDEATQQATYVAKLTKEFLLPRLVLENNGIGKFLPNILRREIRSARSLCRVQEHSASRNKDIRILEAFDVAMATERLHIHKSVLDTPFINEMQEWVPGKSNNRDDGLDAVAGAIETQPEKLGIIPLSGGAHNWHQSGQLAKAKTDFKL